MLNKTYIIKLICMLSLSLIFSGCSNAEVKNTKEDVSYTFPFEDDKHEATWLQWPHNYTYGEGFKEAIEPIWIKMTKSLSVGENVHIVAYDDYEKSHIENVLQKNDVDMSRVKFYIHPTDDVWSRDNGPIFVFDEEENLVITDWGFNGWGEKTEFKNCDLIPTKLSKDLNIPVIDVSKVVLEGGSIELDGNKVCLGTKSAIFNENRNPNLSQKEIENQISKYYGAEKFIWLDGVIGLDITDFHIDGFAKFLNSSTLLTLKEEDLTEWGVSDKDIDTLLSATNINEEEYKKIYLPLSKYNVELDNGKKLDYKGSYLNFYIGNEVVLVPNYSDPNDEIANSIIQELYPNRDVVGIDVRELYVNGGMIHCVTQQQPAFRK